MGPLLHPGLAFAGHWQLERGEEPSFAVLRPYKLLPPMCQVRPPLAGWKKSIILVTLLLPYEAEGNEGTGEKRNEGRLAYEAEP